MEPAVLLDFSVQILLIRVWEMQIAIINGNLNISWICNDN